MRRNFVFSFLLGFSACCFLQSSAAAQAVNQAATMMSLGGTWLQDAATIKNPENPPLRIFIVQMRNQFVGINVDKQSFLPAGIPILQGTPDTATSAKVQYQG